MGGSQSSDSEIKESLPVPPIVTKITRWKHPNPNFAETVFIDIVTLSFKTDIGDYFIDEDKIRLLNTYLNGLDVITSYNDVILYDIYAYFSIHEIRKLYDTFKKTHSDSNISLPSKVIDNILSKKEMPIAYLMSNHKYNTYIRIASQTTDRGDIAIALYNALVKNLENIEEPTESTKIDYPLNYVCLISDNKPKPGDHVPGLTKALFNYNWIETDISIDNTDKLIVPAVCVGKTLQSVIIFNTYFPDEYRNEKKKKFVIFGECHKDYEKYNYRCVIAAIHGYISPTIKSYDLFVEANLFQYTPISNEVVIVDTLMRHHGLHNILIFDENVMNLYNTDVIFKYNILIYLLQIAKYCCSVIVEGNQHFTAGEYISDDTTTDTIKNGYSTLIYYIESKFTSNKPLTNKLQEFNTSNYTSKLISELVEIRSIFYRKFKKDQLVNLYIKLVYMIISSLHSSVLLTSLFLFDLKAISLMIGNDKPSILICGDLHLLDIRYLLDHETTIEDIAKLTGPTDLYNLITRESSTFDDAIKNSITNMGDDTWHVMYTNMRKSCLSRDKNTLYIGPTDYTECEARTIKLGKILEIIKYQFYLDAENIVVHGGNNEKYNYAFIIIVILLLILYFVMEKPILLVCITLIAALYFLQSCCKKNNI